MAIGKDGKNILKPDDPVKVQQADSAQSGLEQTLDSDKHLSSENLQANVGHEHLDAASQTGDNNATTVNSIVMQTDQKGSMGIAKNEFQTIIQQDKAIAESKEIENSGANTLAQSKSEFNKLSSLNAAEMGTTADLVFDKLNTKDPGDKYHAKAAEKPSLQEFNQATQSSVIQSGVAQPPQTNQAGSSEANSSAMINSPEENTQSQAILSTTESSSTVTPVLSSINFPTATVPTPPIPVIIISNPSTGVTGNAPTALPISMSMNEDTVLRINEADILSNTSDLDLDTVRLVALSSTQGSFINNNDGTWDFTPSHNFNGFLTINYTVTDGKFNTSQVITVQVAAVNDAPVPGSVTINIPEDESSVITSAQLLANTTDVDGDILTVTGLNLSNPSQGTLINNLNGTWTFTPNANFNGSVALNFFVSDGQTLVSNNATLNVTPVNDSPVSSPASLNAVEDTAIVFTNSQLVAGSTDIDGDNLTAINVTAVNGSVTNNGNGTWTFTPATNFNGIAQLNFQISDGKISVPSYATINVSAVNDAPIAIPSTLNATEDGSVTYTTAQLLGSSYDVENDILSVSNATATHGTIVDNGNGTWTFTPDANFNGAAQLNFNITDGSLITPSSAIINVAAINDAPVANEIHLSMLEDGTLTINEEDLLNQASDVDGDNLTVANITSLSGGSLINNHDGSWFFVPPQNFNGSLNLQYQISDGQTQVSQNITIDIQAVNDAPIVSEVNFTMPEDSSLIISENDLLGYASDIEGDQLSVTNITSQYGGLVNNGDGTWTFQAPANFNGNLGLRFTVSDGTDSTQQNININVTPINDAPVASTISYDTAENTAVIIRAEDLLANVTDIDSDISNLAITNVSYTGSNGNLVNNGDGTWTFTPGTNFSGAVNLSYTVSDGELTDTQNIFVNVAHVNHVPTASDVSYSFNEDNSIIISASDLLLNSGASDIDGDGLSVTAVSYNGNNGTLIDNNDGTWTFSPNADFNGNIQLSFNISDGQANITKNINLTVNPVNDAPVASAVTLSATEDTSVTFTQAQLLGSSYDIEGDSLSVLNVIATHGSVVDNGDGTWTYTPDANYNGSAQLSFDISDGNLSTPTSATINISAVNDAPVASPAALAVNEDNAITIDINSVLPYVSDIDTATGSITLENVIYSGSDGTLVDNGNGTWTFTPNANFNGNLSFGYTVSDGALSSSSTIALTVNPVNDAPVVTPISLNATEDTAVIFTRAQLIGSSYDIEGSTLAIVDNNLTSDHGTVTYNSGDDTWTFTPDANYNGPATLSYNLSDGSLTTPSNTTVNIAAVNDAPVATPASLSVNEDNAITIDINSVLPYVSDIDTDLGSLVLTNVSFSGSDGTLVDNGNGTWTFTPSANFNGNLSFGYTVSDGEYTSSSTIALAVNPVNDAPIAQVVNLSMSEDSTLIINETDLLARVTDVDGPSISITNITTNQGTLVNNGNGTWSFTPPADFNGPITLEYTASDGLASSMQSLNVFVKNINDAPVVPALSFSMQEDGTLIIRESQLLANAYDADGDALTITGITSSNGVLHYVGNHMWSFTPTANFNGNTNLTFTVSDGTTNVNQTATVNVAAVNDAPVISINTITTPEDTPITITPALIGATDLETSQDSLTIQSVNIQGGIGSYSNGVYTPPADFNGAVVLDITVSDGTTTTTKSITLNVTAVNDAPVYSAPAAFSVSEDSALIITKSQLLANTTDVDGDSLTISGLTANNGSIINNVDGTYTFVPNANFNGEETITFNVSDGTTTLTNKTATINVTAVNDAPVINVTTLNTNEDTPLNITPALIGATDIETAQGSLTIQSVTVPSGQGTYSAGVYTPPANFSGPVILQITVSDGTTTTTKAVTVNVNSVNDAPTYSAPGAFSTNEDTSLVITKAQLLANVTDVDTAISDMSIGNFSATNATIIDNGNDTWTLRPNANYNGSSILSFDVSDGTTTLTGCTATVTVVAVNDVPTVATVTTPYSATDTDGAITISLSSLLSGQLTDVDGTTLSISSITVPSDQGTIGGSSPNWTYTAPVNFTGSVILSYTVTDGVNPVNKTATINVSGVNDTFTGNNSAETINTGAGDDIINAQGGNDTIYAGMGNDTINGGGGTDTVIFTGNRNQYIITYNSKTKIFTVQDLVAGRDGTDTINGNDVENFKFGAAAAIATSTLRFATDTTNHSPVVATASLPSGNEDGTPVTFTLNQLLSSQLTDVDGTTISIVGNNVSLASGTTGSIVYNGNSTWTYTPAANFNGVASFNFTTSDGTNTYAAKANMTINPVNDAPVYAAPSLPAINEDTALVFTKDQLLANTTDIDGDTLTVNNIIATNGIIISNGADSWIFVPDANFNGTATLSFDLSNGTDTLLARTANVTVNAVNDAPIIGATTITTAEDTPLTITPALLSATDVETATESLIIQSITVPTGQGTYIGGVYTPPTNFNGQVNLQVVVSDGTTTTTKTVVVNVTPVNDAPSYSAPSAFSTNEDNGLIITKAQLLANTTDVDGDTLTVSNMTVSNGTIVDNGNQTWTFTPNANYSGVANLNFSVSDGTVTLTNRSATINIAAVNDAPVVNPISFTAPEDTQIIFTRAQLLGTNYDPEGTTLTIVGNNLSSPNGLITYNSGNDTWTFTPKANFMGTAKINYTLSDGSLTTASNTTVNFTPVNDAPLANDQSLVMNENGYLIISSDFLLGGAIDNDGDVLTVSNLSTPQGTLTDNGNGTWTFVPAANYTGAVNMTFSVTDGTDTINRNLVVNVDPYSDLQFNVNSQNTEHPNYGTADNLNVAETANYGVDQNYTGSDNAQVQVNYSSEDNASITMQQEANSGISNVEASSSTNGNVTINNFDRADVTLGGDNSSSVNINNTAEGDIKTGAGDDNIYVDTASTAGNDGNIVNIDTGAGNDTITFHGDNYSTNLNIHAGADNDIIALQGKYASANIFGGAGDDTVIGSSQGNDIFHFGSGQGHDTFNGGGGVGWADSIMLDSQTSVTVTQTDTHSWTLVIDGQEATLTTDVTGIVNNNHLDFAGSASGTITMQDGSSVNFNNIDHVEW